MMARTKWIFGGQQPSQPPQDLKPAPEPVVVSADAKKFGFENFGNTCYANSVLQALYFCSPFRDLVIQAIDPSVASAPSHDPSSPSPDAPPKSPQPQLPLAPVRRKPERKPSTSGNPPDSTAAAPPPPHPIPISPPTLFSALRSLFLYISTHPGDKGTVAPRAFIDKLKEGKEEFRGTMHQDAHEFLNHLLNMIVEEIEEDEKKVAQSNPQSEDLSSSLATLASKAPPTIVTATTSSNSGTSPQDATLVHKLFEGVLTSETRCLTCETVSSRDESFLDLSIDIEQNSSVTACLRSFSASEMLCQRNKFFCDACCDLQEAEKRMKIKKLPNVLALHLKRFKFQEDVQKYIKLTYRVAFPHELRLFNTVDDLENADRLYNLFAITVHIGNGPHHGHYISIVKSAGTWLVFDDDNVYPIPESDIPRYYGDSNSGSAYVLYYQAADIDLVSLGLKPSGPLLLPELQPESIGVQPRTPSQHSQQVAPSIPPGLSKTESNEPDTLVVVTPPPIASPVTSTHGQDKSVNSPIVDHPSSPVANGSPSVPLGIAAPPSPSTTRGILSPVRRATSSHGRPSTAATLSAGGSERSMHPEPTPRSPRHSVSSPSLAVPDDSSPIPPVPPLPTLKPVTPVTTIHLNGKSKEKEKEKDKDKDKARKESKTTGWFKRRSFKLGEKSKSEKSEKPVDEIPASPVSKDERPSSAGWFKSNHTVRRQPSQAVALDSPKKVEDAKLDPPQAIATTSSTTSSNSTQQDRFSSSGPSIVLSSPPTTVSSSSPPPLPPKLSSSHSKSSPFHSKSSPSTDGIQFPPERKSSLAPTSRPRGSLDQQRRNFTTGSSYAGQQRPATVAGSLPTPDGPRQLPPIPNSPHFSRETNHASPTVPITVINGTLPLVTEPESIYPNGHPAHDAKASLNNSQTDLHHSNSASASSLHASHPTSPPPSTGFTHNSLHQNVVSNTLSGGGFKRAKRKLSLTAPILGLGKKDKEKEKERDREKEGRREKASPGSFRQRF